MLSSPAARLRAVLGSVGALSAGATIALCAGTSGSMPMPGGWNMSMAWMRMPGQTGAEAAVMWEVMWLAMMVAMMAPCLWAMLAGYQRRLRDAGIVDLGVPTARMAGGYLLAWQLVGVVVYPAGLGLAAATMRWPALSRAAPVLFAGALLTAAGVQLGRWKREQLRHCRALGDCVPEPRFGPPHGSPHGSWRHGFNCGWCCVRCCSPLMLALLVLGEMDLAVMAVVTLAISAERLLPRPDLAARVCGLALLLVGAVKLAWAVTAA